MKTEIKKRAMAWLHENGMLAGISVTVAIVGFFTIRENISYTETRTVTVDVERESGMALMAVRPASVKVTFRGSLNELRQLDRRDPRVILKAPRGGPGAGTVRMTLRPRHLRGTAGLRVAAIEPSEVSITFDHQGEREFPIAPPMLEGKPLRGRAEVDYSPRTAIVRGARLQLDNLHNQGVNLQLERVNVDGRVQGFSQTVAILPPEDAWLPEITPSEVTVHVDIKPDLTMRTFTNVPVRLELSTPSTVTNGVFAPDPPTVKVTLSGWSDSLRRIRPEQLHVYAVLPGKTTNVSTNRPSPVEVPLSVLLPPGLEAAKASTEPETVTIALPETKDASSK